MIEVLLISCALGFGTGVQLDDNTFITANHVVEGDHCTVNGRSISSLQIDTSRDIYVGRVNRPFTTTAPVISCRPLVTDRPYVLRGARLTTRVRPIATRYDVRTSPEHITYNLRGAAGRAMPGQSGGAVVDPETNEVAGLISVQTADGNVGLIEFSETPLCQSNS